MIYQWLTQLCQLSSSLSKMLSCCRWTWIACKISNMISRKISDSVLIHGHGFKLNFLYQKSTEALWKWFSFFNMWIVEQLWLLTYYHMMQFWSTLFCKNVPKFWWLCAHWFWKIWKNHLAPINMDLKDYSILGASLQIVLPWITIFSVAYCFYNWPVKLHMLNTFWFKMG